ncbi:MAG TPA: carboxypeptidase-like regulatory domain-containing protein [Longimicrobiales bacterium]|nr:carboxypeptidase-like regulatory domain-containing protein [Longimicrobiales bacterium]
MRAFSILMQSARRRARGALWCAFAVLSAVAVSALPLAAQTDVIRGKVTGPEGQPLAGVRVTATSLPGSVTRESQTNPQGNFQIVFPGGPGDYIMGFALFGYNFRQFQVKRLADEDVLIADARLSPVQLDSLVVVAEAQQRVNRNLQTPDVSGTERTIMPDNLPPELQGNIAAMAASLPGVLLLPGLDGEPDGFSVLGLGADQNSITLNGMQTGADGLPRDAAVTSSLVTSPFDVSRGGFSGGNFNIRSRPGSNFGSRGMSFVMTSPQMQWTDRAAQALGNDYTSLSLGGVASGPLKLNKAFYNVSYQLGRQSRDNRTLLSTNALGLQTAGIAMDSVNRFVDILGGYGIPTTAGTVRSSRVNDSGQLFGSIDISPPSSSSGQSFGFNFTGNWQNETPTAGFGQLALQSSGGDNTSRSGGLQARHSGYFGMILTESSAGINLSRRSGEPYLDLPSGRVRVSSTLEDGGSGVQNLSFGGNQGLGSSTTTTGASFQNTLSWFDGNNKHRIKLTSEVQYRGTETYQASNLLGSYSFNSLEDLEAGRPASFSRTLSARERNSGVVTGSMALGDSYRHSPDLQFQYGLRLDANRYTTTPAYNALVDTTFGRRNDRVPTPITVSPRIGFSWTLGQSQDIAMFTGAVRAPRAILRGGIGVFANNAGGNQINGALDNTGLPSGVQQIFCVGPAVPIPDWAAYAANTSLIPQSCADGTSGSVFSNAAPNVTLFSDEFAPTKTVRSNLSWNGSILDARFSLGVEGTYSINLNQQRSLDLNFNPVERFTLADDGRPVFVAPSSIVPATGAIASRDARVSPDFARVTELRSDLQSRTAQLSVRVSPIQRGPSRFGWSTSYTYSHIREQVSGFSSTAGSPLTIDWARSGQGPHQISYSLRYNFFNAVQVNWNGSLRSGSAFTPNVAGDINGDGYSNDRAFIHAPASAPDPAVAAGMQQLLAGATGATRDCLERQLGRIAERNSCRGPWTSNASLNITLDRAKFRMPDRTSLSFSVSNPLGAADLLVNGSGDLRGWGQNAFPDQALLYVRGFDANTQQYRYEVNQRFGATRPQVMTLRSPVMVTASFRFDLGPKREQQSLAQQLRAGRTMPGSRYPESMFRSSATSSVFNPMSTILRSQDTLRLSAMQADSIASMNRRYTYRADSLWTPVARYLATLPVDYDNDIAYDRYISARRAQIDMLMQFVAAVRELLTPEQRRRLPASVVNQLDPRYLLSIRNGTGMYVGSSGMAGMPMMGFEMMASSGSMIIIRDF